MDGSMGAVACGATHHHPDRSRYRRHAHRSFGTCVQIGPAQQCLSGWCHCWIQPLLLYKDMDVLVGTTMPAWMDAWMAQYHAPICLLNSMMVHTSRPIGPIILEPTIAEVIVHSLYNSFQMEG